MYVRITDRIPLVPSASTYMNTASQFAITASASQELTPDDIPLQAGNLPQMPTQLAWLFYKYVYVYTHNIDAAASFQTSRTPPFTVHL